MNKSDLLKRLKHEQVRLAQKAPNMNKSDLLKRLLMSIMQQGWLHHLTRPMLGDGTRSGS